MPKVSNWQLNRKMEFPYEEARPDKQFAVIMNINRCIGCQTCSMADKNTWTFSKGQEFMWWNNVESRPYGGYPQHWDVKLLKMLGSGKWQSDVFDGKTIFEAAVPDVEEDQQAERVVGYIPTDEEWRFPNIYEDTPAGDWVGTTELPEHQMWMFYLQRICNHCTYPGCLAACPRQAIYKRKEDGIVLVDQKRCRGYRKCNKACPYKKTMFRANTNVTEKCIACYPRTENGTAPRCVVACVGKIRLHGWLHSPAKSEADNPVDYLVHEAKVALPLYPQFGTEPNVYYIPPRWAPRPFLRQLFGPGVDAAIGKYTDPDDTLFGLLKLFGTTEKIIRRFSVGNQIASAFDENDRLILRSPFKEPSFVRPAYDATYDVDRFNET
jgi:nitrate reductase beta subunit